MPISSAARSKRRRKSVSAPTRWRGATPSSRNVRRCSPEAEKGSCHMKIDNVADLVAETLAQAGVKRIFGVVGDSLNGLTDALRKRKTIDWIHVRHEEVAAFAAAGEAQITGELAVCAGSCGPGNLHLINGLFDAHRSRTPVLAIAAQIPTAEIGGGYFQETHPQNLFAECSHYCELVSSPWSTRAPAAHRYKSTERTFHKSRPRVQPASRSANSQWS